MNIYSPQAYTIPGVDSMQAAITPPLHLAPLHLAPVGAKAVDLDFDGGRLSSDAGLVLLKDPDEQLSLTHSLAAVLSDPRDPRRVHFTHHDLLKQRIFQIAAGYEDANDANTLRHDPIFKLLLDRLPETGAPLASQPTISRFENRVSRTEIYRMALVLMDQFIASYNRPPEVIVLDVDDTEDRAHGAQEHIRYDGYYGGYCFMPFHLYEGLSGRLITTILKAKRFSGAQMLAVLKRVVKRLRHAWPDTWFIFRGDSHFAYPEVMAWIEAQDHLSSITGLKSNPLSLDPLPSGHMVMLAPCGHQGRGVRTRGQHALCRDGYGASPHPSTLPAHLLCPWPNGKREQRPQALPEIGSHLLSPLRSQSGTLVLAFGSLYA